MTGSPDSRPNGDNELRNPRRKTYRLVLRIFAFLMLLGAGAVGGGFLHFVDTVAKLSPPENPKADAIVVLTGTSQRIDQAISLLENSTGRRLLISGVHPGTSALRLREMTRAPKSLFDCCIDIGYSAIDTIGNAVETAAWVKQHGYSDLLIVTNNYHMPRSLLELHRIDPNTHYIGYPVVNSDLKASDWMAKPDVVRAMLFEYVKLAGTAAKAHLLFWRDEIGQHIRTTQP
jgi:uncharacterized SAM-binding protein YcdF (DUF218 family)